MLLIHVPDIFSLKPPISLGKMLAVKERPQALKDLTFPAGGGQIGRQELGQNLLEVTPNWEFIWG